MLTLARTAVARNFTRSLRLNAASGSAALHTLPDLPYAYDALEPHICKEIMELHHKKHHQAYVTGLNDAEKKYTDTSDVKTRINLQAALKFNGGGHINHSLFWKNLAPSSSGGGALKDGNLKDAIIRDFGSVEKFKEQMNATTAAIQGSGWGWLGFSKGTRKLEIVTTPNQDPLLYSQPNLPSFPQSYSRSDTDFTKSKAGIRIHLAPDPSTTSISLSRLSTSHSNLRVTSLETNEPTPTYNTLLQAYTPSAHFLSRSTPFPSAEFPSHHAATFIDPTTTYNFLSGVPLESLKMPQRDAKITLDAPSQDEGAFDSTFMKDLRDLPSRFDTVLLVNIERAKPRSKSPWDVLEHGSCTNPLLYSLSSTIVRALGTRTTYCAILHAASPPWSLDNPSPAPLTSIDIGLLLNPTETSRLVDHGPPASDEEACAEFRTFWGPKAELRRFKDGTIQESVVWEVKSQDEKMNIPLLVVQYVLEYHFGISKTDVQAFQPALDGLLVPPAALSDAFPAVGVKGGTRAALAAFDELVKAIKDIDENDVPLSLSHVAPISDILRNTAMFPPIPHAPTLPSCATYLPAIDVILQYEQSPRWPEDLAAIQKLKLAFLETIALAAHLLLPYVPEETVELLCAYVYLCPGAFGVPATGQTGFARVVKLLKEWDYRESPLHVPLYTAAGAEPGKATAFPQDKREKVDGLFKEKLGGAGWVITTEKDPAGIAFGPVLGPKASIPARIRQVAAASWQYLCSGMDDANLAIEDLFSHPLDDYDFVIHLKPSTHLRYYQNVQFDSDAWSKVEDGNASMSRVGELTAPKRIYADTALFFLDPYRGTVIAGTSNPCVKAERTFRALAGYSSMPIKKVDLKKPLVTLNEKAVLTEIERLGTGMIKKIVLSKV